MAVLACLGNVLTAVLLLAMDLPLAVARAALLWLVGMIDRLTGAGENTGRSKLPWHGQRYRTTPVYVTANGYEELDVGRTLASSTFPILPAELIERAKRVLGADFGTAPGADATEYLAEDFQFVAPIVGPLGRGEFTRAFGSFKLRDAFPDLHDNSWFHVDPLEPNRVWFFSRPEGTHTGTLNFARAIPPTGKAVHGCPQAQSMLFNERGHVYTLTVGYCMDKRIGNTEGLGGVFAFLKGIGHALPVPEGQRLYTPSLRFEAFERCAKAVECLGFDPTTGQRLPADAGMRTRLLAEK